MIDQIEKCPKCQMMTTDLPRHDLEFKAVHLLMESRKAANIADVLKTIERDQDKFDTWPGDH